MKRTDAELDALIVAVLAEKFAGAAADATPEERAAYDAACALVEHDGRGQPPSLGAFVYYRRRQANP